MAAHAPLSRRAPATRLAVVLAISGGVFVAEVVTGLATNSLALLADAAHVFTDIAGIGLALLAIWLASRPATSRRTFGFYRMEIFAAVINAVLLLGVAVVVLLEAWRRFAQAPEIISGPMLIVGSIGLVANIVAALLLRSVQRTSLNVRGAYLEVLGDTLGSIAVVVAAAVIALTGLRAADAIASAFIGLLIVPRTWSLLREAVDVLLEATPKGVDLVAVRRHIAEAPGVAYVHDLHAWTITSGLNVVSAHIVLGERAEPPAVLDHLCRCLSDNFDIEHSTFQLETSDRRRLEEVAHD